MKKQAIERLQSLLTQLSQDAAQVDEQNKQRKSHYYLQDQPLFDDKLFPIVSSTYYAYVKYAETKLTHLKKLMENNHQEFSDALLEQLEEQILSLITAIKSNDSRYHDSQYRLNRRKRLSAQKKASTFTKAVKTIMLPSHQLHGKLAKAHGFERRLEDMLRAKQQQLNAATRQDTSSLQLEVLILHQRLGRCRKAISELERQIQQAEQTR